MIFAHFRVGIVECMLIAVAPGFLEAVGPFGMLFRPLLFVAAQGVEEFTDGRLLIFREKVG